MTLARTTFVLLGVLLGACSGGSDSDPEACTAELEVRQTEQGVRFVRTPDACFAQLPDWPYQAKYVEIEGLRQAYVDEGPQNGETILLLHGQPSWSYLYRHMIPSLVSAGYRVIAMDHLGMGRSDKPVDLKYFSFAKHETRLTAFMNALQLRDINLFAQDWGSIIGLYVAAGDQGRFKRIVIGNGGLPIVSELAVLPQDIEASNRDFDQVLSSIPEQQQPFFDANGNPIGLPGGGSGAASSFGQWIAYARDYEGFKAGRFVEALTYRPLTAEEEAAYDAPFPSRVAMAGPRAFPNLLNQLIGITESRRQALTTYQRPFLTIFGGNDPGFSGGGDDQRWMSTQIAGAIGQPHQRNSDASHFLQDDKGPDIAASVIDFIKTNP
jgi:haloalkane dehalogenase